MSTNCYLIENDNHSIIIDPGDQANQLIDYLIQNNLKLIGWNKIIVKYVDLLT